MPFRALHVVLTSALSSVLALGALTSATPVAAIQDTKSATDAARALIQEEARAVQSIDHFKVSHQVDITNVTPRYNQTTHAYVKTWIQRPGHIRAESQQYNHSETIVSDGSMTWVCDSNNQKHWKQVGGVPPSLFSNAFPGLARQLTSANLPSVMTTAKLAGMDLLTIAGRSYSSDVVDVIVMSSASNSTLQDNTLRLWISREYKIPLKVEATFVGVTSEDRKKYSDYVTEFEPNLNIPVSVWKLDSSSTPK